ncbi:DUF642 domain-containing protein [Verrucomicrobiaceae bacterium N1E253]|uniref:DUF642 domain-containing protein n=1 Tax=Oceaniferula marina TaxID=2748318 RepID=A0A851GK46_9BACT|nr:DUF642 domain-containing protein [Oceaniferula marina]NWK56231.1 DUF642 domain-containing protein [Oceaniferula marina]
MNKTTNHKKQTLLLSASIAVFASITPEAQSSVFANGGFDDYSGTPADGIQLSTLTPSDWTTVGTSSQVLLKKSGGGLTPQNGSYYLGIFNRNNGVSQTFDTVAGYTYELSFYLAKQATSSSPTVDVNVTGNTPLVDDSIQIINWGQDTWQQQTVSFTADSASTSLSFIENASSQTSSADVFVDTIVLSVTSVPEPSATTLLGLGGLALILRRKK